MFRQRAIHLLIVSIILITQPGCWSSKEIEDLSVYTGLALDKGEPDALEREFEERGEATKSKIKLRQLYKLYLKEQLEIPVKMEKQPEPILTMFLRLGILCLKYSANSPFVRTVRLSAIISRLS